MKKNRGLVDPLTITVLMFAALGAYAVSKTVYQFFKTSGGFGSYVNTQTIHMEIHTSTENAKMARGER